MAVNYKMIREVADYLVENFPGQKVVLHELADKMEADLSFPNWEAVPVGVLVKIKDGPFFGLNVVKLENHCPLTGYKYLETHTGPFPYTDCEFERIVL